MKRSGVWNLFAMINSTTVRCKICRVQLLCKQSSNLKKHIRRQHPAALNKIAGGFKENYVSSEASDDSDEPLIKPACYSRKVKSTEEKPLSRRRSVLWDFFNILDKEYASCRTCKAKLSYKSTIQNLRKHLNKSHPGILPPSVNGSKCADESTALAEDVDYEEIIEYGEANSTYDNTKESEGQTNETTEQLDSIEFSNFKVESVANATSIVNDVIDPLNDPLIKRFKILNDTFASCLLCNRNFRYLSNYNNLQNHLITFHPDVSVESIVGKSPGKRKADRKRSKVWSYVGIIDKTSGWCKLCRRHLNISSTSNLFKHMKRRHSDNRLIRNIEEFANHFDEDDTDLGRLPRAPSVASEPIRISKNCQNSHINLNDSTGSMNEWELFGAMIGKRLQRHTIDERHEIVHKIEEIFYDIIKKKSSNNLVVGSEVMEVVEQQSTGESENLKILPQQTVEESREFVDGSLGYKVTW